jgi:hypothetical protein
MGIKGLATVGVTLGAYRRISDSYSRIRKEMKIITKTHTAPSTHSRTSCGRVLSIMVSRTIFRLTCLKVNGGG